MRFSILRAFALGSMLALPSIAVAQNEVLAVGFTLVSGSPESSSVSPLILKHDVDGWRQVALHAPEGLELFDVTFSSPRTAWAVGAWGNGNPALLRSDDVGETWTDSEPSLPSSMQSNMRLTSVAFADDSRGWVAGMMKGMAFGPYLASTTDGGKTWHEVNSDRRLFNYPRLAVRNDEVVAYKQGVLGREVVSVTAISSAGESSIAAECEIEGFMARSIHVVDGKEWVVGEALTPSSRFDDKVVLDIPDAPRIYAREGSGQWRSQSLAFEGRGILRRVHARDATTAIAGGKTLEEPVRPLLLSTSDGSSWTESTVPESAVDTYTGAILRGAGGSGWVVAHRIGTRGVGFILLETTDGGMSWDLAETGVEETGMVHAFAESSS